MFNAGKLGVLWQKHNLWAL